MSSNRATADRGSSRIGWTDHSGKKWKATLLCLPQTPANESEIQVESEFGIPERVLCLGPILQRFHELTMPELGLIRRAAQARSGILWLDARDGQLWWVKQEASDKIRWQITYSNHERVRTLRSHPGMSVARLRSNQHEQLLDDEGVSERARALLSHLPKRADGRGTSGRKKITKSIGTKCSSLDTATIWNRCNYLSRHSLACISSLARVLHFLMASGVPPEAETINAELGKSLYNQAMVTFIDDSGTHHLLVLGGTDVANEGTPSDAVVCY